jgi:hypothetical protein
LLLQHRLHSLNSREFCYLNVTNSTPHAVRMLWLDYQGNEVSSSASSSSSSTGVDKHHMTVLHSSSIGVDKHHMTVLHSSSIGVDKHHTAAALVWRDTSNAVTARKWLDEEGSEMSCDSSQTAALQRQQWRWKPQQQPQLQPSPCQSSSITSTCGCTSGPDCSLEHPPTS